MSKHAPKPNPPSPKPPICPVTFGIARTPKGRAILKEAGRIGLAQNRRMSEHKSHLRTPLRPTQTKLVPLLAQGKPSLPLPDWIPRPEGERVILTGRGKEEGRGAPGGRFFVGLLGASFLGCEHDGTTRHVPRASRILVLLLGECFAFLLRKLRGSGMRILGGGETWVGWCGSVSICLVSPS